MNRRRVGPSSTHARDTTRFSGIACRCSAFATAEFRTLIRVWFGPRADRLRMRRASSTCRPRMRSTDRRIFRGATRMYFAVAFASNPPSLPQRRASFGVVAVDPERPGRGELAQLVADHRFGDEHGDVLAAVVHRDGVPHHLVNHGGAT